MDMKNPRGANARASLSIAADKRSLNTKREIIKASEAAQRRLSWHLRLWPYLALDRRRWAL